MIFAPPRHTKSELGSRRFPAWYLGRNPDRQVISATYAQDFADDFGHDVRQIIRSDEFRQVFAGVKLAEDSQANSRWRTASGGLYVSVGVGGPLTGRGAHLALIDDPFKNRQDADSSLIRERVWRWYTSVFRTRLMPGGAIVLICTRWHEDDLAGRLIAAQENGGEQWEIVSLPAIYTGLDGVERALWPEWYPLEELHQVKGAIGGREFLSLYQQVPTAEQGEFFKRQWFRRFDRKPEFTNVYMSGDFAVTPDDGDFTELAVWGVDTLDNAYALDWWDGQTEPDEWITQFLAMVKRWKPLYFIGEMGSIRRAVGPTIERRLRDAHLGCPLEWLPTGGKDSDGKQGNARPFRDLLIQGRVYFPNLPWAERVIDQCLRFPGAKHDDAVDTCSLFGRFINKTWAMPAQPKPKATIEQAWQEPIKMSDFAARPRKEW